MFAQMVNYGGAMLFISILAGTGILGGYILTFAAHSFMAVVEQTSSGSDKVIWPDEPFTDWIFKGIYLFWLMAVLSVPIWFLLKPLDLMLEDADVVKLAIGILLLWAAFPIVFLSSTSSLSPWVTFCRLDILRRLGRVLPGVGVFYALSAVILAVVAGTLLLAHLLGLMLPVAGFVVALGILYYGRLVGRLGRLIHQVQIKEKPQPEQTADAPAEEAKSDQAKAAPLPAQPAAPAEPAPEIYGFAKEELPPPMRPPIPGLAGRPPKQEEEVEEEEEEEPPLKPAAAFLDERVYRFPFYPTSLKALVWLSLDMAILVTLFWLLIRTYPYAD